jgi:hypothetical protein
VYNAAGSSETYEVDDMMMCDMCGQRPATCGAGCAACLLYAYEAVGISISDDDRRKLLAMVEAER